MNLWYLDDRVISGPANTVANYLAKLSTEQQKIGLQLNPQKCEIEMPLLGDETAFTRSHTIGCIESVLPGIEVTSLDAMCLLGLPLADGSMGAAVEKASGVVETLCHRLKYVDAHTALYFLTHYVSAPRLTYVLRTSPLYKLSGMLDRIDDCVRSAGSLAMNVDISGRAWEQASLPPSFGGLGLRKVSSLALPCYISSLISCSGLIQCILSPNINRSEPLCLSDAIA